MKKCLLLFALIVLSSCNNDDKDSASEKRLTGRWLWVSSTGGFSGTTPVALGQKKELEFTNGRQITYINGALIQSQKFDIKIKKSIFGDQRKMIVIDKEGSLTNVYYYDEIFKINGSELILTQNCVDCYVSKYKRVSN